MLNYDRIEIQKELMLIEQIDQKNVCLVIIGIS